jgi:hypothetical protein
VRIIDDDELAGRWLVAIDLGAVAELSGFQFRYALC